MTRILNIITGSNGGGPPFVPPPKGSAAFSSGRNASRDRSTASIDHRHRKIPPAFASNHLRSIRHYNQKGRELARFLEASIWLSPSYIGRDCGQGRVVHNHLHL